MQVSPVPTGQDGAPVHVRRLTICLLCFVVGLLPYAVTALTNEVFIPVLVYRTGARRTTCLLCFVVGLLPYAVTALTKEVFIPVLVSRTGPYSVSGMPIANG